MSTATVGAGLTRFLRLRRPGATGFSGIEIGEGWVRYARQDRHDGEAGWRLVEARWDPSATDRDESGIGAAGPVDEDRWRQAARKAGLPRGPAVCALNSPHIEVLTEDRISELLGSDEFTGFQLDDSPVMLGLHLES